MRKTGFEYLHLGSSLRPCISYSGPPYRLNATGASEDVGEVSIQLTFFLTELIKAARWVLSIFDEKINHKKSFNSMTSRVLNSTRANVETNWQQTTECWASATKKRCLKFTQTWRIFHLFAALIWLAVAAAVLARATVWQCVTSSWEKQNSSEFHEKIVLKSPLGLKDDGDQRQVIHRVSGRFRSITT